MTYLLLGIIGIVLASAAALVVMNYGGDYFLDAYNDADVMDVENGLTNVLAAYRLHQIKIGAPPANIQSMLSGTGSGTLETLPTFHSGALLSSGFDTITVDGVPRRVISAVRVPEPVCMAMNVKFNRNAIPVSATGDLGCFYNGSMNIAYKTV